jgi:hypothetical protein
VLVYPGADSSFALFSDDGTSYDYEKGGGSLTHLHWNDAAHAFTHEGAAAWSIPDSQIVEVIQH